MGLIVHLLCPSLVLMRSSSSFSLSSVCVASLGVGMDGAAARGGTAGAARCKGPSCDLEWPRSAHLLPPWLGGGLGGAAAGLSLSCFHRDLTLRAPGADAKDAAELAGPGLMLSQLHISSQQQHCGSRGREAAGPRGRALLARRRVR
jgi:hypothetical protein